MTMPEFLSHCTACGGNWTDMLLSGIRKLWPGEIETLPEVIEFTDVLAVLRRHNVETT